MKFEQKMHNHNTGEKILLTALSIVTSRKNLTVLVAFFLLIRATGCVSDKVSDDSFLSSYQRILAELGPQQRLDTEGRDLVHRLGLLKPVPPNEPSDLRVVTEPNTGTKTYDLTIEEAIARTLANSPEIRVVSVDPSIAKTDITKAAAEFDVTAFGRLGYEKEDNPVNSLYQLGQSSVHLLESGIKQKITTGAEWSLSYALTRAWDDLAGRIYPSRYEPILAFEIKQPLLRNAWGRVNLAGVNVARLNHEVALLGFRQKAEDISTEVISAYWQLLQARRNLDIQQRLLSNTLQTLEKVQGRKEIDATAVQIKQAEASAKAREAVLLEAQKSVSDTQDVLARLMADPEMNLVGDDYEIVPVTTPYADAREFQTDEILGLAMKNNPAIQQARIGLAVAKINVEVAENQRMPRLDFVASMGIRGLSGGIGEAHDILGSGDYVSYALGFSLEFPLGNRDRRAERYRRKLERRRSVSALQNTADQIAVAVKQRIRKVKTNHAEIQVQKDAAEAAKIHLQALEDAEAIRERLTPEFLLVKLQAQQALAEAQRAEVRTIVDFNVSIAELAQATGTVLQLHEVRSGLPAVSAPSDVSDQTTESDETKPDSAADRKK